MCPSRVPFVLPLLIALSAQIAAAQVRSIYEQAAADIQAGNAAPAIHALEGKLQENPQDLKALTLMGMALVAAGRPQDGNAYFLKALQVNRAYVPALRSLAASQLSIGQPGAAVSNFQQLVQQMPGDPGARFGLAQAYLGIGERDKAGETLEGMPGNVGCRITLAAGNLLAGMERYASAAREFGACPEQAIRISTMPASI